MKRKFHIDLILDNTAESMSGAARGVIVRRGTKKKVDKGEWWMPWLIQAMKDVISCEKPR